MRDASTSASAALALLFAFVVGLGVASDAALRASPGFWRYALTATESHASRELRLEAGLRLTAPGSLDTVILGSSIARDAVSPADLGRKLGVGARGARTFHVAAGFPAEVAMLADRFAGLRARRAVFPVTHWTLHRGLGNGGFRFYDASLAAGIFTPGEIIADFGEHASGVLRSAHVVVRHRKALRERLWTSVFGRTTEPRYVPLSVLKAGALIDEDLRRATVEGDFTCEAPNVRALVALGRRLAAAGTRLVLVATPVDTSWHSEQAIPDLLDRCLGERAGEGAFDYIPFAAMPGFSTDEFRDTDHLNEAGRRRYTEALAKNLQRLVEDGQTAGGDDALR